LDVPEKSVNKNLEGHSQLSSKGANFDPHGRSCPQGVKLFCLERHWVLSSNPSRVYGL
jgi:hypothetical protein